MSFSIYIFSANYITRGKLAQVVGSVASECFDRGSIPPNSRKFEFFFKFDRPFALTGQNIAEISVKINKLPINCEKSVKFPINCQNIEVPIFLSYISCRDPPIHDILIIGHNRYNYVFGVVVGWLRS